LPIYHRQPRQERLRHFSQHRQLAHELIIGQLIQRLHLEMNILGQNPSNYTQINVRLLGTTRRNGYRSMLLEIIVKRRNEVLGQLIPAAFWPTSEVAGLPWPPQVGWSLLRLC
jgi:hypothetical protein